MGGLAAQELARMLEGKSFSVNISTLIHPYSLLNHSVLLPSELESQIRQLGPDFFSEEPDLSEDLPDLDINYNQVGQITDGRPTKQQKGGRGTRMGDNIS